MSAPIKLWNSKSIRDSDDAGIVIVKTVLPSTTKLATLYDPSDTPLQALTFVPKLEVFCLKVLSNFPEELHVAGTQKLRYAQKKSKYDVFRSLFPTWGTSSFSLSEVDPRLWATVVQLYSNVPDILSSYPIALGDEHLPLLQRIPSTDHFAMITVLDLRDCQELSDDNVAALKGLEHLCAFDATNTPLGSRGITRLSRALVFGDNEEKRGPWSLRILRLRKCRNVDQEIFACLKTFPLLCAVDVRETACLSSHKLEHFRASPHDELFDPYPIGEAVNFLHMLQKNAFSHKRPFTLSVQERLQRAAPQVKQESSSRANNSTRNMQGAFVVLPSSSGSTSSSTDKRLHRRPRARMQVGNIDAIEIQKKKDLEAERSLKRNYAYCMQHGYDFEAYHNRGVKVEYRGRSEQFEDNFGGPYDESEFSDEFDEDGMFLPLYDEMTYEEILSFTTERHTSSHSRMQQYDIDTSSVTFYKRPLQKPHVPARRVAARHADDDLMLYRDPPAWYQLENSTPESIMSASNTVQNAKLKVSGKGKSALSTMARAMSLRKATSQAEIQKEIDPIASQEEPTKSQRRPLAAWKNVTEPEDDISDEESPMSIAGSVTNPDTLSLNRILRPISNLKPPSLPAQLVPKPKKESRLKQTTIACSSSSVTRPLPGFKPSCEKRDVLDALKSQSQRPKGTGISLSSKPCPSKTPILQSHRPPSPAQSEKPKQPSSSRKVTTKPMDEGGPPRKKVKVGFNWDGWSKGTA